MKCFWSDGNVHALNFQSAMGNLNLVQIMRLDTVG